MSRFYRINFNSTLFLTSNGLIGGLPCKLEVSGVENLLLTRTGFTLVAIDGTPQTQIVEQNGKGFNLEIKVNQLTKTVFESLVALINDSIEDSTTIEVNGTGDTGNFSVDVIPLLPNPFTVESFSNNYIKNIILRFVTT